jgi:hypothetical protein
MRIKKLNTPIFMTTTTKFGADLINSAPKKCPFRYDLVWVKSAPAGFLSAKKMPMRKHEMVYVFYEKLPYYDLSSHKHKFIKEVPTKRSGKDGVDNVGMIKNRSKSGMEKINKYDPPLPVSVVKEEEKKTINTLYGGDVDVPNYVNKRNKKTGMSAYEPPLPVSVVKEPPKPKIIKDTKHGTNTYDTEKRKKPILRLSDQAQYEPPLPVSVVKEDCYNMNERHKNGKMKDMRKKTGYEPPLPVSVVKDEKTQLSKPKEKDLYGGMKGGTIGAVHGVNYDPPLPTTMLEIKSTRGKHSTEKPVALMEWILKYYSKEGDVVLDPTMGSGSTGVACKNMNRNFIGIEMNDEIYEVAVNRIEE